MTTTITTEQIKELRERTGVSVMQVRKALEEAGGDMEKAILILRKKGSEAAGKKADRTFGAGTVQSYIHSNNTVGTMVELLSETDFVSGHPEFKALARDIAMHIAASNPEFISKDEIKDEVKAKFIEVFTAEVEEAAKGKPAAMKEKIMEGKLNSYFKDKTLLDQPYIKNPELTIGNLVEHAIQKFGEKIAIGRFVRFSVLNK